MKIRQQSGFTLIELVMVIVILGILAATALPKFVDLKTDASKAAAQGVAGALASASTMNKARRTINSASGVSIANCTDLATLLDGGVPTGYTIGAASLSSGSAGTCIVSATDTSQTVTFTAYGA